MRNWVFCSAFIYTALHRVESEVPCKGEYWSKIGSSARDKTKRRGDLGKWMTLIPQTRVGNGARDTQWQLELEPVLTQLYSQQVYTQVHKKDLKQTVILPSANTSGMQASLWWDPMTQKTSVFISLQKKLLSIPGTKTVESKSDWGKTQGILFV